MLFKAPGKSNEIFYLEHIKYNHKTTGKCTCFTVFKNVHVSIDISCFVGLLDRPSQLDKSFPESLLYVEDKLHKNHFLSTANRCKQTGRTPWSFHHF